MPQRRSSGVLFLAGHRRQVEWLEVQSATAESIPWHRLCPPLASLQGGHLEDRHNRALRVRSLANLNTMPSPEDLTDYRVYEMGPRVMPMPLDNQSSEQNKHKINEKIRQPVRLANRFQWGIRQRYQERHAVAPWACVAVHLRAGWKLRQGEPQAG